MILWTPRPGNLVGHPFKKNETYRHFADAEPKNKTVHKNHMDWKEGSYGFGTGKNKMELEKIQIVKIDDDNDKKEENWKKKLKKDFFLAIIGNVMHIK